MSKYGSNFGQRYPHLRVRRVTCDFTVRWFASFANVVQRLPEQARPRRQYGQVSVSFSFIPGREDRLSHRLVVTERLMAVGADLA
jgi:hypothetical protein